jgi:hypothetical protein
LKRQEEASVRTRSMREEPGRQERVKTHCEDAVVLEESVRMLTYADSVKTLSY